jgi:ribonuclease BN (tRNA processing enzyme)
VSVRVRFLGSGDAFGSGGRFQTCIAVQADAASLLLDCGASSLIAMRRFGFEPLELDAVIVSHLHGDHFGGLPFLLLDAQFRGRTRALTVAGPPGLEARLRDTMEALFPGSSGVTRKFALTVRELQDGRALDLGGFAVTPYTVVHPSGAPPFALRVHVGGRVVAYSGDTEWTEALVEAARGADLFICEAYHFDKRVKYHLDWQTLRQARARLSCQRLVLTHMSGEMLARRGEVDAECAEDGAVFELGAG